MKTVQISVTVPTLRTNKEAEEFAQALAEHVLETFNDDDSITACYYRTQPTPSYKTLVATLGSAVAEWSYLFPEKFDDNQHEVQSRKNLKKAERVFKQALKVLEQEGHQ